jgi:hypothetical protein
MAARAAISDLASRSNPTLIVGSVKGGQIYSARPTLELCGPGVPTDLGSRIPTIAVDTSAAKLASRFRAGISTLFTVLPNLLALAHPACSDFYESSFTDRLSTLSGLLPVERTGLWCVIRAMPDTIPD